MQPGNFTVICRRFRPTKDVLVRNITVLHGEGPAIGSEQSGGISNVTFEDLWLGKQQTGPVIKSCRGRGTRGFDIVLGPFLTSFSAPFHAVCHTHSEHADGILIGACTPMV